MEAKELKHFFVNNTSSTLPFTSKQQGGEKKKLPPRDRGMHGALLQQKLHQLWEQAKTINEQRTVVSLPTKNGTYLEFESAPDYELATKSLENRSTGIRLLNVRKDEVDDKIVRRATVFIPAGKESF